MNVYPAGMGNPVCRRIESCGQEGLNRLCRLIWAAFEFDRDPVYGFCMDDRMYSKQNDVSGSTRGYRPHSAALSAGTPGAGENR